MGIGQRCFKELSDQFVQVFRLFVYILSLIPPPPPPFLNIFLLGLSYFSNIITPECAMSIVLPWTFAVLIKLKVIVSIKYMIIFLIFFKSFFSSALSSQFIFTVQGCIPRHPLEWLIKNSGIVVSSTGKPEVETCHE